jgi:hypothetical protein
MLLPLAIWSDSAIFYESRNKSGHPVMISCPLFPQVLSSNIRLYGFLNMDEYITSNTNVSAEVGSILRALVAASSMAKILEEINQYQKDGGIELNIWGISTIVIPYICYVVGDLVETKKLGLQNIVQCAFLLLTWK